MGFLSGKKALITGIASKRSIAYGIAQSMAREGAELALTYQNEKLKPRVENIAEQLGSNVCIELDVAGEENIDNAFYKLASHWENLDILIHSIAMLQAKNSKAPISILLVEMGLIWPMRSAAIVSWL